MLKQIQTLLINTKYKKLNEYTVQMNITIYSIIVYLVTVNTEIVTSTSLAKSFDGIINIILNELDFFISICS